MDPFARVYLEKDELSGLIEKVINEVLKLNPKQQNEVVNSLLYVVTDLRNKEFNQMKTDLEAMVLSIKELPSIHNELSEPAARPCPPDFISK